MTVTNLDQERAATLVGDGPINHPELHRALIRRVADALAAERARVLNESAVIVQAVIGLPMRLKAHRAAHNLSGREVAKRCGMSFATVSRIENGEDYMVSNLVALAAYLDHATPEPAPSLVGSSLTAQYEAASRRNRHLPDSFSLAPRQVP